MLSYLDLQYGNIKPAFFIIGYTSEDYDEYENLHPSWRIPSKLIMDVLKQTFPQI